MKSLLVSLPCCDSYKIETNDIELKENLFSFFSPYISDTITGASTTIISAEKKHGFYTVRYNGSETETNAVLSVIHDIVLKSILSNKTVFAFHGAAVCKNNSAILFLAATQTGKTTLSAFLTKNGYEYITDDCILIDCETLNVFPCTTPLKLREGGLEVLRKHNVLPFPITRVTDAGIDRYIYSPSAIRLKAAKIKKIFFLQRSSGINRTTKNTTAETIALLLKSPLLNYPVSATYLKFITRLTKIGSYELAFSNLNYVLEQLQ